jgi:hypothetical protein
MSRTRVSNAVQRVKRQLASSFRYEVNVLQADVSQTDTTVSFQYEVPASVITGAVLSIANEEMRVMGVDRVAREATVLRGWNGSTPMTHQPGDEVHINPRFSGLDIFEALIDEVTSWGPDLYRTVATQESVSHGQETIYLPFSWRNIFGLVDVRRNWTENDTTSWARVEGRLQRGVPGSWTDGPRSGVLFRLFPPVYLGSIYFVAAAPLDVESIHWNADLVGDIGLKPSMLDVLDMGIKWRLLGDSEAGRSARVAQDTPRRAEEVPPRSASDEANRLYPLYVRRKAEEVDRLRWQYPLRFT